MVFRDQSGNVVYEREVKCLAGDTANSFNREMSSVRKQMAGSGGRAEGEVMIQVKPGTNVQEWLKMFQRNRTDAQLEDYSGLSVRFVDPGGGELGSFNPAQRL